MTIRLAIKRRTLSASILFTIHLLVIGMTGCGHIEPQTAARVVKQAPVSESHGPEPESQGSVPESQGSVPESQGPVVLVEHPYFQIWYDESRLLPKYVKYRLTADRLRKSVAKRKDKFIPDPVLQSKHLRQAAKDDYKGTGYDRGHMAPAAAFSFSQEASDTSFVMTNMAPQTPSLNRDSWKRLESEERRIGCGEEQVLVYTGPIFDAEMTALPAGVSVPKRFFKVILDETPPKKALAVIYNQSDHGDLMAQRLVVPVDVSRLVGVDFGEDLRPEERAILTQPTRLEEWSRSDCGTGARQVVKKGKSRHRAQ